MITNSISDSTRELAEGVFVEDIAVIESPAQLAELLVAATASEDTVIPFGGRRSLATGNLTSPARWGVDLTGLRGILAYEPADLTLSVRAGTSMAEIQSVLGDAGQELPIDVPFPDDTTIGGLVATGFAGPRKLRSGSLRDLLIGCEFVRGDGLLAKAGGLVVKNVSGFEIPRFLHGSWGSLAVLTSVNLKVAPTSRADGTLVAMFDDSEQAIEAARRLIAAEPAIEACVVRFTGERIEVAARAVGRTGAVTAMLDSFEQGLGSVTDRLEADASRAFWQDQVNSCAEDSSRIVIAMSTRPRDVQPLTTQVNSLGARCDASVVLSPGLGSLRMIIPCDHLHAATCVSEVLGVASTLNIPHVLESAPGSLRSDVSTWGVEPEGFDVMRSVKRQFDPANILNPGRLFL